MVKRNEQDCGTNEIFDGSETLDAVLFFDFIHRDGVIPLASSAAGVKWLEGNIATLQALDKITARISTLEAPVGKESFLAHSDKSSSMRFSSP